MDLGMRKPLASGEMVGGWKSWAKCQPVPWPRSRKHDNSSGGRSTPTSSNTLKKHQQRGKPVIVWTGLLVREVYVIFMHYHWVKRNSLFHINLANPDLQNKGKCPGTQPG